MIARLKTYALAALGIALLVITALAALFRTQRDVMRSERDKARLDAASAHTQATVQQAAQQAADAVQPNPIPPNTEKRNDFESQ